MMSDIVDRLRTGYNPPALWREAANEIERLRAERDEAVAALTLYRMEHGCTRGQRTTQWCGEATRLREALRELLRVGVRVAGGLNDRLFSADDEHPLFDTLDEWRTAADAARAALKETGHE
jgi:hypothetical protein